MVMALVLVKYKYGSPRPTTTSSASLSIQSATESAVLAELQRLRPTHKNVILISIDIKRG